MKFVPKRLTKTADISRSETSLGDVGRSILGLVLLAVVAYWVMGRVADLVAVRISVEQERKLAGLGVALLGEPDARYDESRRKAQQIVDALVAAADLRALDYDVQIVDKDVSNAFALPGGGIGLTTELIDGIETEEELAMILGHELGHFAQKDHLRGLGRGLLLSTAMILVGGTDLASYVGPFIGVAENRYSRRQEEGADLIGLALLAETYGHAGGATRFFERLGSERTGPQFGGYLSTHPEPRARAEKLRETIAERSYPVREEHAWSPESGPRR